MVRGTENTAKNLRYFQRASILEGLDVTRRLKEERVRDGVGRPMGKGRRISSNRPIVRDDGAATSGQGFGFRKQAQIRWRVAAQHLLSFHERVPFVASGPSPTLSPVGASSAEPALEASVLT